MTPLIESEKERNNRSAPQEAELKGIIDEIMTEVSNTKGERVVPLGFVAVVGYLSAGAGVGGAVGVIAHKVYDWATE